MRQDNHHFLFPQIYFGSLASTDEPCDMQEDEIDAEDSCILSFDTNGTKTSHQKIGLYIDWTD
jgi:hypothetical protein